MKTILLLQDKIQELNEIIEYKDNQIQQLTYQLCEQDTLRNQLSQTIDEKNNFQDQLSIIQSSYTWQIAIKCFKVIDSIPILRGIIKATKVFKKTGR